VGIWRIAVYLLLPYAVGNLIWRGLRYPEYWHRWPERFGFVARLSGLRTLWVHAVSVGEVRSAAPLVSALVVRYPKHRIVVTTMTPTGSKQVRDLFGDRVSHCYVPFDFPGAVRRFLDRVRPEAAVIAETEFWPNIFAECGRRRIPLLLVNGRVSQASLRGYLRVPNIARAMLANADLLCAQTRVDAQRLRNLGAAERVIHVTGNLKFDVEVPARLLEEARELRGHWGGERPVLIAASTHAGEERKVLAAYAGPVITRFEIEPAIGVKGAQIVNLMKDLARALSVVSIRVVETIPGKSFMGLELPNAKRQIVRLVELLSSTTYNDTASPLSLALGKDILAQCFAERNFENDVQEFKMF